MISIWSPCLNFAIRGVTCSLVHRIRCAPDENNFHRVGKHVIGGLSDGCGPTDAFFMITFYHSVTKGQQWSDSNELK